MFRKSKIRGIAAVTLAIWTCLSYASSATAESAKNSYTMLSGSLFPYNRITTNSQWWKHAFRYETGSIPRDEVPTTNVAWHTPYAPQVPFRFPADIDKGNALPASGAYVPIPKARCKAIWLLAASADRTYSGNVEVYHEDGSTEIRNISIPFESAVSPGQGAAIEFSHANYDLYRLPDILRIFIFRIPVYSKSRATSLSFSTSDSSPIIYAITSEHIGQAESTEDVSGKVVDTYGFPVKDATVNLGSYSARTDANGVFRMKDVVPSSYDLLCSKLGCELRFEPSIRIHHSGRNVSLGTIVMKSQALLAARMAVVMLKASIAFCLLAMLSSISANRPALYMGGSSSRWRLLLEVPMHPVRRLLNIEPGSNSGIAAEMFGVAVCLILIRLLS